MTIRFLLIFATVGALAAADPSDGFVKLFNGTNLAGFDTFLKDRGLNEDPDGVFRVRDGVIHVSGTEYGYIITKREYENYHLRAEFKWGVQTHAPRKDVARDSGILFHVVGPDQVWPKSVELQMIEGRTGEIILVGEGTSITRDGETKTRGAGGTARFARYNQGPWKGDLGYRDPVAEVENPHGEWNLLELLADGDTIKYLVNGKAVNHGTATKPSRGRILFQSEGAELFFRNIQIRPIRK